MGAPYQIDTLERYHLDYRKSVEDPGKFWADIAATFTWKKKWDKVLDWNFNGPMVKWFINGKLNITENCLDRWVAIQPDKPAIIWEPNDPAESSRTLSYKELYEEVCRF